MPQTHCFNKARSFPGTRDGAAVFHRCDVIGYVMEHQRRDIDLRSQFLMDNFLQYSLPKIFIQHKTKAMQDLVWQACDGLKTRQRIQKLIEGAKIYQSRRRREIPFDQSVGCDQSSK